MTEQIPLARLAKLYLKMRVRIQELTQEYETQIEAIKAQQHEVKMAMKEQMMANGRRSCRHSPGQRFLNEFRGLYSNEVEQIRMRFGGLKRDCREMTHFRRMSGRHWTQTSNNFEQLCRTIFSFIRRVANN